MASWFGTMLRDYRTAAGLTQEQLSERSGVSVHSISELETTDRTPRMASALRLAEALTLDEAGRQNLLAARRGQTQPSPDLIGSEPQPRRGVPKPRLLPYDLPDFLGRDTEVKRLLKLRETVGASTIAMITIDGMAGVGKTALAVHASHRLVDDYPDGQLFLDLHGYTPGRAPMTPATALTRLLRAAGVADDLIPHDEDERADLWRSHLAGRRMLFVLDNAVETSQVRPLLPGAAGNLVLVTTRRRMPALPGALSLSLDVLPPDEAEALFAAVAGRDRVRSEPAAVSEIVDICGRLPLAVRIAAARLAHRPSWTVAHLLNRLRDRHGILAELAIDDHSVATAFSLSYGGLSDRQQRLFRLLGLHPGEDTDSLAAAALVGLRLSDTERLLQDLVDHHLLIEHTPGRYTFHDLLRHHARTAADRDEDPDQRRAAVQRLFGYYLHTSARAMDLLRPHERHRRPNPPACQPEGVAFAGAAEAATWISTELATLLAWPSLAQESGDATQIVSLSAILSGQLDTAGRHTDAIALHTAAVEAAGAGHDRLAEADMLNNLANSLWRRGRYAEAIGRHQRALALARAADDPGAEARALTGLGDIYRRQNRFGDAIEQHTEALALARRAGDEATEADALNSLASAYNRDGNYAESKRHHTRALSLARRIGDQATEARSLTGLGVVHRHLGAYDEAIDHHRKALNLARAIGDRATEAHALGNLGIVFTTTGRYQEAVDCHRQAFILAREVGDLTNEAHTLNSLGVAHRCAGRLTEAVAYHQRALLSVRPLGLPGPEIDALNGIGEVYLACGDIQKAVICHDQALEIARKLGDRFELARAYLGLGDAHYAGGQPDLACRQWKNALELRTRLPVPMVAAIHDRLERPHCDRQPTADIDVA